MMQRPNPHVDRPNRRILNALPCTLCVYPLRSVQQINARSGELYAALDRKLLALDEVQVQQ